MNKINDTMVKIAYLVLNIFLFLVLIFFSIDSNNVEAFTFNENELSLEMIAHNCPNINENFEDDNVLVVLDKRISDINKKHDVNFFNGLKIESIKDLTKREFNFKNRNNNFRQILQIFLKEKGKENVLNAIAHLEKIDGVFSAEPNYYYEIAVDPNDSEYVSNKLWGLNGTNGIDANNAWDLTKGDMSIRVGIIDTGIANHEDLNANLVSGIDTFNNNDITNDDTHSHGTHVAGTIGAVGNNEIGVVGVNWNVSLVPLQAANASNLFYSNDVIEAIEWAQDRWDTDERISIINYSVGGFGTSTAIRSAIDEYNGLFVWAAGNDSADIDEFVSTFGSFNLDNIISVGSLNSDGSRRLTSNYSTNNTNVHIYAPGTDIYSTVPFSFSSTGYSYKSGTSMAAPHVTGVAALLLSLNDNLTAAQLKNSILSSAEEITITIPDTSEGALEGAIIEQDVLKLNAYNAVRYVLDNYIINLNCATTNYSLINNCPENDSIVYKVNVKCPKSYKFISNASSPLDMTFYDSSFNEIATITPAMTNNNCTGTIITYLNPGTYYLRVNFVSGSSSGNITTSYQVTWPLTATLNNNLNILNYLHLIDTDTYHCVISFNNTYGEKLFKFKLDAENNATYSAGAIKVYADSALTNQLDRYSASGLTYPASSNAKENELYVFLPENGIYYIEITVPRNDYNSLQFLVADVDEMSIDYLSTLATSTNTSVFSYKTEASYFKKVDISHRSKIKIELNSDTSCFNNTKLFIFKLNKDPEYDIGVNHYSLSSILHVNLTFDEDNYNTTIILDEGTYYFGYTNNTNCSLNLSLRRLINNNVNMDGTLVSDPYPNQGYTIGSEVLLNDGSYNNYNITEGFTRCIYLMVDDILLEPNSRLAYDWYSSNDNIAVVTQYGTVLAKSVDSNTNVTIYAILKEDPSVVYRKTFTILNDTLTYATSPIDIYVDMTVGANQYTPIDLSGEVVPINILQYYSWSIQSGGTVDSWGIIYAYENSLGNTLYITGDYIYNTRVKIHINAFVALPMSGYELDYNPSLWDDDVESNNNCYNYAINSQVLPGTNTLWFKQQPGEYSNNEAYDYTNYNAMYNAVYSDFVLFNQTYNANLIFTPIDKFTKCPEGTYKVALVAYSGDYHWYRQDSDGYWSHKPGIDNVRRYDDSFNLIIDPSNCDWGIYDTFLGFFAVSPWNTMYTEPENMRTLGEANPSISLVDLDDIGDLEIGMSYYEVVQTLGSAGLDIGSGTIIQQYKTTSNNKVLINYHLVNGAYVVVGIDVE